MKRLLLYIGLALALASSAVAQVPTSPFRTLSDTSASSTITTTNTFQQVFALLSPSTAPSRAGCLIINTSLHRMWVYFTRTAEAVNLAKTFATAQLLAIPLEPATAVAGLGGSISCASGANTAAQDAIWIAGTATDTFTAVQE